MKNSLVYYWYKLKFTPKRRNTTKNICVSFMAIVAAVLLALFIAMAIYGNGSLFYQIIKQIFLAPFVDGYNINSTLCSVAIFAVAALSFLVPFRCGLFNIGVSGQMMFGAIIAIVFGQHMSNMPTGLGQVLMLLISIVGATMITGIIGLLKAFWNVNEVVSSIMFSWIIYFVGTWLLQVGHVPINDSNVTQPLPNNLVLFYTFANHSALSGAWLPLLIILAISVIAVIVFLGYTTVGRKIINTGMSNTGALYAGYKVKFNQILAMLISGVLAGILGIMVYCGKTNGISCNVMARAIPQEGFTGISVGLIAMSNPLAIPPIAFFFGMIDAAKSNIATVCGVDISISDLMFGIVVYGTAVISVFYYLVPFRWYLLICRGKNYADGHQKYERYAMQILSDASNDFYAFKKAQDADASLISQSKFSNKYLSQIKRYWNRRLNFSDYNHQKHLLHSRYCLEIKIAYMIFIKEYWETSKRNFMEKRKISLLKNTHLNSPKQQEIFHYRVDQFQKNISNAQISINYYQTLLKNVKKGMII